MIRRVFPLFLAAICCGFSLFLLACGKGALPQAQGSAQTTLDLRDSGLKSTDDLIKQTQLTRLDLRGNELTRESMDTLIAALPN
jgi:Leucine-rich repeat (LRR) protein